MDINVETAKRMLKEEVENAPYVIEESFGNAGTYRKLISFFVRVNGIHKIHIQRRHL